MDFFNLKLSGKCDSSVMEDHLASYLRNVRFRGCKVISNISPSSFKTSKKSFVCVICGDEWETTKFNGCESCNSAVNWCHKKIEKYIKDPIGSNSIVKLDMCPITDLRKVTITCNKCFLSRTYEGHNFNKCSKTRCVSCHYDRTVISINQHSVPINYTRIKLLRYKKGEDNLLDGDGYTIIRFVALGNYFTCLIRNSYENEGCLVVELNCDEWTDPMSLVISTSVKAENATLKLFINKKHFLFALIEHWRNLKTNLKYKVIKELVKK